VIKRTFYLFNGIGCKPSRRGKERSFWASTDEGPPSKSCTGLNGNMYVVDMHPGVIQHYGVF